MYVPWGWGFHRAKGREETRRGKGVGGGALCLIEKRVICDGLSQALLKGSGGGGVLMMGKGGVSEWPKGTWREGRERG